jgi:hypothetical protein
VNLIEIAEALNLENLTPKVTLSPTRQITGAYTTDLLSDVLAHAPEDGILITVQVHLNVLAVCIHAKLAAAIFTLGRHPDEFTRSKAEEEGLILFSTEASTFEVSGKLYELGLRCQV